MSNNRRGASYVQVNQGPTNYLVEANSDDEFGAAEQHIQDEAFMGLPIGVDATSHISKDIFTSFQTVTIDFDITASPAELAADPGLAQWSLASHLSSKLKQNLALKNRHLAGEGELAGNLGMCLPLGLDILQQQNELPFFMGIQIPGMMNTNLHRDGSCLWRVPPNTQTMGVNRAAFQPVNVVNQWSYHNLCSCTSDDLKEALQIHPAKGNQPGHSTVLVGSLPYELMVKTFKKGGWRDQLDQFDAERFFNPGPHQVRVQCTEQMGREMLQYLAEPIKEAEASLINLNDLVVNFVRADGVEAFDTPKKISGEIIGNTRKGISTQKINTAILQKRATFHIKADFHYQLF
jgi:hypothetical protein